MKILNVSLCMCLAVCVHSIVLPIRVAKDHRNDAASMPPTFYANIDQRIFAVQGPYRHSPPTAEQEAPRNPRTKPPFRHEIMKLPYPAQANSGHVIHPQSNITVPLIRSTLLRVISSTKHWTTVRETGHRGDTRSVIIWIKTSRRTISKLLRRLECRGIPGEADSPTTLASKLSSIDRELEFLRENIEADGQNQIWGMAEVLRIGNQILPKLEEMAASLERS
jgi:hypothetical protein